MQRYTFHCKYVSFGGVIWVGGVSVHPRTIATEPKKAEKHFEEMKQSSSAFMDSQNAQYAVMKKQVNVYKIVSLIAITASLASIFLAVYI